MWLGLAAAAVVDAAVVGEAVAAVAGAAGWEGPSGRCGQQPMLCPLLCPAHCLGGLLLLFILLPLVSVFLSVTPAALWEAFLDPVVLQAIGLSLWTYTASASTAPRTALGR